MLDGIEEPLDEITLGIEGKVQSTSTSTSTVPPHDNKGGPMFDHNGDFIQSSALHRDNIDASAIGTARKLAGKFA